jgi:hypothetical protein
MDLDGYVGTLVQSFSVLPNCFFNNNEIFIGTFVGFSFVSKYLAKHINSHWNKYVPQVISLFPDDVRNIYTVWQKINETDFLLTMNFILFYFYWMIKNCIGLRVKYQLYLSDFSET